MGDEVVSLSYCDCAMDASRQNGQIMLQSLLLF